MYTAEVLMKNLLYEAVTIHSWAAIKTTFGQRSALISENTAAATL